MKYLKKDIPSALSLVLDMAFKDAAIAAALTDGGSCSKRAVDGDLFPKSSCEVLALVLGLALALFIFTGEGEREEVKSVIEEIISDDLDFEPEFDLLFIPAIILLYINW